ncbi:MAG: SgcJ/EcaC family oxidoreductase [Anaerolineae bacterium]|nr:SgcJ/EcaC family oxidoreductase [Gloeobacterales cyanobacterium ES-bin-313]
MQAQEIRDTIKRAANAWVALDAEAFSSLFTDDGEFIFPGKHLTGQTDIQQSVVDFAATSSDVSIKILQILVASPSLNDREVDRAAVEWHWENTDKATGNRYKADDAILIDFRSGEISRWREYIDSK